MGKTRDSSFWLVNHKIPMFTDLAGDVYERNLTCIYDLYGHVCIACKHVEASFRVMLCSASEFLIHI